MVAQGAIDHARDIVEILDDLNVAKAVRAHDAQHLIRLPNANLEKEHPIGREHAPRLALDGGADGLDFSRVICETWRDVLGENGMLFFEVGIGQADSVLRIMRSSGFGDIQIVKDLNNIPRVVYGTRVETI